MWSYAYYCESYDVFIVLQHGVNDLENFLLVLCLCHTVIPEEGEGGELTYRASSPDEEALVMAAMEVGVVFKVRTPNHIIIEVVSNLLALS